MHPAGPGFMPARHIGELHVPHQRQVPLEFSRKVQFHARNMIEIELQSRALPAAFEDGSRIGQSTDQIVGDVMGIQHLGQHDDPVRRQRVGRQREIVGECPEAALALLV